MRTHPIHSPLGTHLKDVANTWHFTNFVATLTFDASSINFICTRQVSRVVSRCRFSWQYDSRNSIAFVILSRCFTASLLRSAYRCCRLASSLAHRALSGVDSSAMSWRVSSSGWQLRSLSCNSYVPTCKTKHSRYCQIIVNCKLFLNKFFSTLNAIQPDQRQMFEPETQNVVLHINLQHH